MTDKTAEIIPFRPREKSLPVLRRAIEHLHSYELLFTAGTLMNIALDAYASCDDAEFYERVKAAYLALERLLIEGGRI